MKVLFAAAATLALGGCATLPPAKASERFFDRLQSLCGRAFTGRLVSQDAADAAFRDQPLVMHVRDCRTDEIRIPFHVGDDRSRTWVVTRTSRGLRLKHDHRQRDGSADDLTMYGGNGSPAGTIARQLFPADAESIALFTRTGRTVSNSNVWALEVSPTRFAYELRRPPGPGERFFRVEFDLSAAAPTPPPPWGW
ncbi:hypothetical protein [Sphingomonas sp. LHG3406-1]|uniref:hypothetical protein n=1 Tax=Sphingomonas sp. LHG3406-1 TaxID=2804617 RepID=UPI00260FCA09|nr:hypothetical protein [Sphingomonas sp. LHG3406-1]